jgi:predicted DNA-binding protein YlxM (UPF0122 family)
MKRVRFVLPLLLVLVLLAACAHEVPWKKPMVTTYELGGIALGEVKTGADYLLSKNLITAEQHKQVDDLYQKAKSAYKFAGDAMIEAIGVTDDIKRNALLETYNTRLDEAKVLAYKAKDLYDKIRK